MSVYHIFGRKCEYQGKSYKTLPHQSIPSFCQIGWGMQKKETKIRNVKMKGSKIGIQLEFGKLLLTI